MPHSLHELYKGGRIRNGAIAKPYAVPIPLPEPRAASIRYRQSPSRLDKNLGGEEKKRKNRGKNWEGEEKKQR